MVNFPNAKINLGLSIVEKMNDGYHSIETVFVPIKIYDVLEVLPSEELKFSAWGIPIPGNASDNLCLKAFELLKADFGIPACHIHLLKNIPFGAGLGGGSADAAFLLKLLNQRFDLGLSNFQLMEYGNRIGSDCAFFIENKPIYAHGRGNQFKPLSVDLSSLKIVLIKPFIHISTAEAYAGVKPKKTEASLLELLELPIAEWKGVIKNDFEDSLFPRYPELAAIKNKLYELGAIYASMSGSGSSIYGIVKEYPKDLQNHFPETANFCC